MSPITMLNAAVVGATNVELADTPDGFRLLITDHGEPQADLTRLYTHEQQAGHAYDTVVAQLRAGQDVAWLRSLTLIFTTAEEASCP